MRLIDADALDGVVLDLNVNRDFGITRGDYKMIDAVLFEFPTIEERKTGKWIRKKSVIDCATFVGEECSECGYFKSMGHANFCPNCGADMRGEQNG